MSKPALERALKVPEVAATRKALMRHAETDITDGYSHARLSELAAAIGRLRIPAQGENGFAAMTGTDNQKLANDWTHTGHGARTLSHTDAQMKPDATSRDASQAARSALPKSAVYNAFHQFAQTLLSLRDPSTKVARIRPSTQVD